MTVQLPALGVCLWKKGGKRSLYNYQWCQMCKQQIKRQQTRGCHSLKLKWSYHVYFTLYFHFQCMLVQNAAGFETQLTLVN